MERFLLDFFSCSLAPNWVVLCLLPAVWGLFPSTNSLYIPFASFLCWNPCVLVSRVSSFLIYWLILVEHILSFWEGCMDDNVFEDSLLWVDLISALSCAPWMGLDRNLFPSESKGVLSSTSVLVGETTTLLWFSVFCMWGIFPLLLLLWYSSYLWCSGIS